MEQVLELIRKYDNFLLAGHVGPDGDSIGSCFGLAFALEKMGKKVSVALEPYPKKYNIIPGRKFMVFNPPDDFPVEVFIALDCASKDRLVSTISLFDRAEVTICIDHHETNPGFADFNYIEPTASSTSEIVFKFIENLTKPTAEIASAIYAGMVSDTGGFRFGATKKSTMEIAAKLMEMGIPFTEIYNELMYKHRFAAGKAMGLALMNSVQSFDGQIIYSSITRDMLSGVGADPSDLDGVVEYLMDTKDALVAVLVYEKATPTQVKVSLRSKGPNMGIVSSLLGGGGHQLAAGATVSGTVEEIMERTLKLINDELSNFSIKPTIGIINVYKEKGFTSHDVVAILRKYFGKRVGHTGTLDPDAEGVLPICIGRATKLSDYISSEDKTYVAEVVLGKVTNTGDLTGEVINEKQVCVSYDEIKTVVDSFTFKSRGVYNQKPPMFSAIKIGGKKLYELARKGKEIERPTRPVKISDIKILNENLSINKFTIEVTCSKGTYIRSLCVDIGEALGCGGTMGTLVRTRSGQFKLENAYKLDEIKNAADDLKLDNLLNLVDQVLPFQTVYLSHEFLKQAKNGSSIPVSQIESNFKLISNEKYWVKNRGLILGLYTYSDDKFKPEVML